MITSRSLTTFLLSLAAAVLMFGTAQAEAAGFNVARVHGSGPITLKSYVFWSNVSNKTQIDAFDPAVKGVVAVPPKFGSCVRTVHQRGKSWKQSWLACQSLFLNQNNNVMSLLISSAWIRSEAKERGLSVSRSQILAQFRTTKKAAFPNETAFRKFLRASGQTVNSMLGRIKTDMLSNAIREDVTRGLNDAQSQEALTAFMSSFQSKWKSRTVCNTKFSYGVKDMCAKLVR